MDFKKSKLTLVVVEDDEQVIFFPYLGPDLMKSWVYLIPVDVFNGWRA